MVPTLPGREHELLERLKAGIVVLDSAGVIVHWNADAERILSLSANEAVGRPWTEVMAVVSGVDITGREVRATALRPGGWHGLTQLQVKNCPPLWVRAHIQETTLTPGERPGVAAVFWEAGSNADEPNPPARLRDISHDDRLAKLLRDLGMVTGRSRADGTVEQATRDALDVIASAWRVDATIAVLDRDDGRLTISGSATPEAIRAVIGNVETPRLHLGPADNDAVNPIEVVFAKQANLPVWTEAIKSLGVAVVRSAPLWLGDNSTGTLILMWNGTPEVRFDGTAMAQVGQHLGLVVGNAALRQMMRREAALRVSLEDSARVGGVVVAQISDAILTLNIDESITAINPAGERQYGVAAEEVLGRAIGEVLEQLGLDGEPLGTDAAEEARSSSCFTTHAACVTVRSTTMWRCRSSVMMW